MVTSGCSCCSVFDVLTNKLKRRAAFKATRQNHLRCKENYRDIFPEQSAERFCSTPPNRQSATHRRNTRMWESPRMAMCVCYRPTSGSQNRIDLLRHGMIDLY